jgi:hypothetical protein
VPEITFEDRVAGLRGWARGGEPEDRAAVELLIWHESWLRRPDFAEACITQYSPGLVARIDWHKAGIFAAGRPRAASTSQMAILDVAVTLGQREESWLRFRGDKHAEAVVTAIASAMGVSR